jgi:hypothetical protein
LLAGTGGIDERVVEAFQNRFNVETSIFRIPESLRWRGDRDQAAPFSAVVGLAISGVGDGLRHFNFVHPKEPEGERRERVKRVPYLAIGAAAIVALLITAAYMPIHRRNARIEELRAQIAALSADEKARKELTNQLADIELWQKRNVVWLDTMREIAENIFTTNKDAYLTRLDFSEDGSVRMELLAAHNEVAPELVRAAWQLRDKNGKPVYSGDVGDWDDKGKNEKYPITDELRLKLNALAAKPAKKK